MERDGDLSTRFPCRGYQGDIADTWSHLFPIVGIGRRNILFQTAEEKAKFHVGRNVTNPHVHAGFQFIKMFFNLEARTFHEIGRKKPGNALNNPGMFFDDSDN